MSAIPVSANVVEPGRLRRRTAKGGVLMIGNFLSAAGGSRGVCEELAPRLSDTGWSVVTASNRRGRLDRLADMLQTVYRRRNDYQVAQVDVFSGAAFFWAEAACASLQQLRKPFILTLHGGNLPLFAARWPWRVRRLLASAKIVTAPSRYLQEQMSCYCPNIRLLPNALDLQGYRFRLRGRPEPSLVWLRAFHEIYNPAMTVEVLGLLAHEFPLAHLTMVGPDKGDRTLEQTQQAAARLAMTDRLRLTGQVPKTDVPAWLNRGDVFLNTTNADNSPVSVLEAMACGLCVVSTNVGGLSYLLAHRHDALLVPPNDPAAMAAAVTRVLTDARLAERLSRNGRTKAEQHDWAVVLPHWESLLESVGGTGRQ
jgi:glycosyltransferase involved in cell wall biosynthesis